MAMPVDPSLFVRTRIEATGRAPGRTIDVGKPNESNRTRGPRVQRNRKNKTGGERRTDDIEAGREKCIASLSSKQKL